MGYADMLGMFKGVGKGVGPGVEGDEAQGGMAGFTRAAGGALQGAGAGLIAASSPRLARALQAQDHATQGAYHNMYADQHQQNEEADLTTTIRSLFGSNPSYSDTLKAPNSPTGMKQNGNNPFAGGSTL